MKRRLLAPASILFFALVLLAPAPEAESLNPNHDCSFCHDTHGAPGFNLLNNLDVEVLCLTCHGPAGTSTLKAEVHTQDSNTNYAPFSITCTTCHDSHSDRSNYLGSHNHDTTTVPGVNIKLVGQRGPSGTASIDTVEWSGTDYSTSVNVDVVFEFRGGSEDHVHGFLFNDPEQVPPFDGVCQVCHTQTDNHCNENPGNPGSCKTRHNRAKTCTQCHEHFNNFNP